MATSKHVPALDGLRGLAIAGVLVSHFARTEYGFAPLFMSSVLRRLGTMPAYPIQCALWTVGTLLVAALSWEFFEAPLNKLKNKFILPRFDGQAAEGVDAPQAGEAA